MPVHAYSGVTVSTNGVTCFTPSGEFYANGQRISLAGYSPQEFGTTQTLSFNLTVPSSGLIYLNIHLDYGLKGTAGYAMGGSSGNAIGPKTIVNHQSYTFSYANGGPIDSRTVQSVNSFKKNPGVGGSALKSDSTDPVANAKVQIYDSAKRLLGTVSTDSDGWYMWQYKYTGKTATFSVKMPAYNRSQSATLKSNGFVVVNFTGLP